MAPSRTKEEERYPDPTTSTPSTNHDAARSTSPASMPTSKPSATVVQLQRGKLYTARRSSRTDAPHSRSRGVRSTAHSPMQRLLQFVVSFVTILAAVRADATRCNFTAVIDVANAYYPGCVDLYNVLEQSMPVNFTRTLCDDADCMAAMDELRSMDLGDCIVFGSTTLTSDILDQCPATTSKSTAWVGWIILALYLALFIPIVVYRFQYHRKQKAQAHLDLANGKLGVNDAPYKVIDLAGTRV